ncbi:MAG: hypothetical protein Q7J15_10805 [Candidatus Desulfaltia sp.]|nr:hypothetical protein [Candidatus Desulfaltia sp.]
MTDIKDEGKCLASLAVFRELHNSQKDIYGVICAFLNEIIATKGKYQFNLTEITNSLNETFDFAIPEAVVRTSLGRLDYLNKAQGNYIVKNMPAERHDLTDLQKEIQTSNRITMDNLLSFVAEEKNCELTDSEKESILNSFCSFLLDDSNSDKFSEYISGFVIRNQQNDEFRKKLNQIREGVILYSGLKYSTNLSDIGSWKTELTIYLDTEILFHCAGYNGKLYKSLFDDFFEYVKEINRKSQKRLIKLKYFKEVKNEIESYFTKAQFIVEGKEMPNPKVTAMNAIIEGCTAASDVIAKKSDFYLFIKNNGIAEDDISSYYEEDNFQYNIIDKKTIEDISAEVGFDISDNIRFLNFINICRKKGTNNNFDNIGCILITGNSKTIKVAWHNLIKTGATVPLATTLYWLTNKFWFKLNKGFGNGAFPKAFDIITKAQIVLSSILNETVGEKYEELQTQFKEGKLTEDQVKGRIVHLRTQVRKPEDIKRDDISSILDAITEDSIEQFVKEQEHFKNQAARQAEENRKLIKELDIKEKKLRIQETKENDLQNDLVQTRLNLLQEKKATLNLLEKQKLPIDKIVSQQLVKFKIMIGFPVVLYYLFIYYLIWKLGWNDMEKWTYILGSIPLVISFLYLIFAEKDWNPKHYLKRKRDQFEAQKYDQFNFNISKLDELRNEVAKMETEIDNQSFQRGTR